MEGRAGRGAFILGEKNRSRQGGRWKGRGAEPGPGGRRGEAAGGLGDFRGVRAAPARGGAAAAGLPERAGSSGRWEGSSPGVSKRAAAGSGTPLT